MTQQNAWTDDARRRVDAGQAPPGAGSQGTPRVPPQVAQRSARGLRRYVVMAAGVVLSLVFAFLAAASTRSSYQVSEDVVFLVSPTTQYPGSAGRVDNAYLGFGDLKVLAKAVSSYMAADTTKAAVQNQGATTTYTFGLSGDLTSPITTLTATAPSPREALKSYNVVLSQVQQATSRLQGEARAPASTLITALPVGQPSTTTSLATPKVKTGLFALVAGLVLTTLVLFLMKQWQAARSRHSAYGVRQPSPLSPPGPSSPPGDPVPPTGSARPLDRDFSPLSAGVQAQQDPHDAAVSAER